MKPLRKALILLLAVVSLLPNAVVATEDTADISVTIDGVQVDFADQPPARVDGRTLVPVRSVFETLGFDVDWNRVTQTATLTNADYVVIITINNPTFTTNGESHDLDVPAQIIGGRTLLPIRAVLESVGYYVRWDNPASTVIITTGGAIPAFAPIQQPNTETLNAEIIYELLNAELFSIVPFVDMGLSESQIAEIIEQEILRLTNIERANYGLHPLIWSDELGRAARNHSEDMVRNNMSGHIGSDGSRPGERAENEGWSENVSENFAGFSRPRGVVRSFMNSPGHRASMLSERATHMGAGFAFEFITEGDYWRTANTIKFGRLS